VFAGTMAPLISSALGLGKLSVGPPYFNPTFLLSMLPLLALLSLGIHARWKRGKLGERARPLVLTLIAAAVIGCAVVFGLFTGGRVLAPVGVTLGAWIILSSLIDPIDRLRRHITIPRAVLGMTLAHIGLGIFVISITAVEGFTAERDVALAPGTAAQLGAYQFEFEGVQPIEGPNYSGVGGTVIVTRNGCSVSPRAVRAATRSGERTSSRGLSARIVPAPTRMASTDARSSSTSSRSCGPDRMSRRGEQSSRQPSTEMAQLTTV